MADSSPHKVQSYENSDGARVHEGDATTDDPVGLATRWPSGVSTEEGMAAIMGRADELHDVLPKDEMQCSPAGRKNEKRLPFMGFQLVSRIRSFCTTNGHPIQSQNGSKNSTPSAKINARHLWSISWIQLVVACQFLLLQLDICNTISSTGQKTICAFVSRELRSIKGTF